jgi:hypothetical protein
MARYTTSINNTRSDREMRLRQPIEQRENRGEDRASDPANLKGKRKTNNTFKIPKIDFSLNSK